MSARAKVIVSLQLSALLVLGVVTVARFHIWAPVDERAHYAYVQSLAEDHRLPLIYDLVSPQVQAITDRTWPRPSRTDRRTIGIAGRNYEAFEPPLYYVVAAPAFLVTGDYLRKVRVLRVFDSVLVAVAVWLLWRLSAHVAPRVRLLGFAAALTVLLWPGVLVRSVTVSPTPLELVVTTALLIALWRLVFTGERRMLLASGALLGVCLLTKPTLAWLAPLVVVAFAVDWAARRDTLRTVLALALPVAMLAPWLAFNYRHYHALTAAAAARAQQRPFLNPGNVRYGVDDAVSRTGHLLDGVLPAEWYGQLHVGWVRVAVTVVGALLFGGALVVAVAIVARRGPWRPLWFFAVPLAAGYAILVDTLLSALAPGFNLRYVYPLLPALAMGVAAAVASRSTRVAWGGVVVSCVLLSVLWVDMAGAFYFTDVGHRLGI